MRKLFFHIAFIAFLAGCQNVSNIEPANSNTFIKFVGTVTAPGEYNEFVDLEVDDNGSIFVLWNFLQGDSINAEVTQLDLNGNFLGRSSLESGKDFEASDLLLSANGYIVLGTEINITDTTVTTSIKGINQNNEPVFTSSELANSTFRSSGLAETGDAYLATASISDSTFIYRFDKSSGSIINTSGSGSIPGRDLFVDGTALYWSSTVPNGSDSSIHIFTANSQNSEPRSETNLLNLSSNINSTTLTASVESTQLYLGAGTENSNQMILFVYDRNTNELSSAVVGPQNSDFIGANSKGLSVAESDGTLVYLGSITNSTSGRNDKDFVIIRTDFNGGVISRGFETYHGGLGDEEDGEIKTHPQGGYVIAGTTRIDNSETQIVIMRVNENGELNFN